jgi:uncharacterized membrane protein
MWKLLLILLVGLFFESVGVVCLKKGITEMGAINGFSLTEIVRVVKSGITNKHIFEALFFGCLLLLMSRADVSFVWPLTALSFVFTTFAAMWFLHEKVSTTRWIGVVLILIGAGMVSWSEKQKEKTQIQTDAPINQETQP